MKVAVPLADGKLAMHFGHCKEFALVPVTGGEIGKPEVLIPPPHEPGVLPRWLNEMGANLVIAGGMGQRAIGLFAEYGIKVLVGAPALAPEELVRRYLEGTLETGQNVCDH
ncbi:MAG: NifB/NifX family molybdenum-iron cluster-binding protein [Deltaproteobacteria bacterium]|nr:NifB/NifX family molybdenum-iron cluster-binding protein [Deltaproteobacteria bacterium]